MNGKTVLITGGNAGIGLETAVALAKKGAQVVIGCRSEEKGRQAVAVIRSRSENDSADFLLVDLADLNTVKTFALEFLEKFDRLDVLINNAGLMHSDAAHTKDGFELQFGVNHLGHFLLTRLLQDRITKNTGRIVNVSSGAHYRGTLDFETLKGDNIEGFPVFRTLENYKFKL